MREWEEYYRTCATETTGMQVWNCCLAILKKSHLIKLNPCIDDDGVIRSDGWLKFNLHVNDASDRSAQRFLRLLEAFNLKQHVWVPTHRSGNTLDLVITRNDESTAQDFDVFDPVISDHYVVNCSLALPKKAFERKEVNSRKLKTIDLQELRDDISDSPLTIQSMKPVMI